ncbi:MAG: DUF924 domain-containing protein [Bdellovibrionales bacterium]|nr:DUF924 domain-containing protein [Bdellovibrionales bacterium]
MYENPEWQQILSFWFEELSYDQWWIADPSLDDQIRHRFLEVHKRALRGELFVWRAEPGGRLAEIIVLDQLSRNLFRGRPEAFRADSMALALCQEAISRGADQKLSTDQKAFLYLPLMHSESLVIHELALEKFKSLEKQSYYQHELQHRDLLVKFGRYPARNKALSRESTQEELKFLESSGP